MKIPNTTKVARLWRATLSGDTIIPATERRDLARSYRRNANELDRLANNDLARNTASALAERLLTSAVDAAPAAANYCHTTETTEATAQAWDMVEDAAASILPSQIDAALQEIQEAAAIYAQTADEFQQAPLDDFAVRAHEFHEFQPFTPYPSELAKELGCTMPEAYKIYDLLEAQRERYAREVSPPTHSKGHNERRRHYYIQPRD